MTKSEFKALSERDKDFFEYLVDKHNVFGFETFWWLDPGIEWGHGVFIPTLKGLHLVKYYR